MSETPFTRAARAYFDSSWSPIPLPHKAKSPVPDSPTAFTGASGAYVDGAQLRRWLASRARAQAGNFHYPPSNIAIRLPKDLIGIDLDAYGDKKGAETIARAEEAWGPLPLTWVSTSRQDGLSGIRIFRIPEGLSWPGELPQGKGVELIRWDHRYMIVAPSIHDLTGEEYRWCREVVGGGEDPAVTLVDSPDEFPDADGADIPPLPESWVEGLTSGKRWEERAVNEELTSTQIQEWLAARPSPGVPCSHVRKLITKGKTAIQRAGDDGGVHEAALEAAWGLLNDAKAGHAGIVKALAELRLTFLKQVEGRRDSANQAKTEWARIVARGVGKVTEDANEEVLVDPCATVRLGTGGGKQLGSGDVEELTETGNSNRIVRVMNGRGRWVPGWKNWAVWSGLAWSPDIDGQAERWAVKAIEAIDEEAAQVAGYENGEALVKAYKAHKKSSLKMGAIRSSLDMVKSRKGITVQAEMFDASPRILVCPNGTIELRDEGVKFRPSRIEDYNTLVTGADYEQSAQHELWDDYLKRFQPDEQVRDWLQRIVGYSLLGANPEQFLVVGLGLTSTGKTTFTEGLFAALGGYGGPLEATVLKTSGDDKPRPDILKALPRRLAIAEELSEFQNLHVDQVKRITGAGTLSARGMNSDRYVERRAAFTPWLMTNEVPHIEGADAALRSRVLVVPFDVFQQRSRTSSAVRERIIAEAGPAILAWAVAGWEKYLSGADLREIPTGAWAANAKFAEGMSDVHLFVSQRCELLADASVVNSHLYEAYQIWCAECGIAERDQLSGPKFGRRMTALGTQVVRRRVAESGGKQIWHRVGVRLL